MANRFTQVPAGPPPLDRTQLRLLPFADAVMWLMFSRPGGLSLRNAWVTPASMWLCLAVSCSSGILGFAAAGYGLTGPALLIVAGLLGILLATGTGCVAVYGMRQRQLARR